MSRVVPAIVCLALAGCSVFLGNEDDDGPPTPAVLITPQDGIDFGKVVVGFPSAAAELDVVGLGDTPPLVVDVSHDAYTMVSDDCTGAELVLGQVCKLRIQFVPAEPGPISATVNIGIGEVPLVGEGLIPGDLVADRQFIDFGAVEIDQVAEELVTISNVGDSDIDEVVATPPAGFSLPRDECTGELLAPQTSCELLIRFAPMIEDSFVGSLSVSGLIGAMPIETSISLGGQGTSPIYRLTVEIFGNGSVTAEPGPLLCEPEGCFADYPAGTAVKLTSAPPVSEWQGDCTGTLACMVTMDRPRTVRAYFVDVGGDPPFPGVTD